MKENDWTKSICELLQQQGLGDNIHVDVLKNGYLKISGIRIPSDNDIHLLIQTIKQRYGTVSEESIIETIKKEVEARTERSAWSKGVTAYALELVEGLEEAIDGGYFDPSDLEAPKLVERALLNGASDWSAYSWGGCSLIYDGDIAERLCCPSELKKTRNGERRPNSREEWLDVQARALFQACNRVKKSIRAALAA